MIFIKVFQMQNTLIKMTMELQKIRLARRVKNFMHSFQKIQNGKILLII